MVKREGRAAAASEGAECHRKTAPAFFSSADEKRSSPALADGPDIKFRPVTGQNRPVYDRFLYRPRQLHQRKDTGSSNLLISAIRCFVNKLSRKHFFVINETVNNAESGKQKVSATRNVLTCNTSPAYIIDKMKSATT